MADFRVTRVEQGQTRIRSVPIAVTPEGFWCCPSPVVFQKTLKAQNPQTKPRPPPPPPKAPIQKKQTAMTERKLSTNPSRMRFVPDDQRSLISDTAGVNPSVVTERAPKPNVENLQRKLAIEFGEPGTSDLKVILSGKPVFSVKMSVHKNVLVENSTFFSEKLSEQQSPLRCLEIDDCEDVEIYVEVVGLMYCKEMKQRLIKQSVSRVLRILKVAEVLGFKSCMQSCLEYLEAVPWVGEEEEKVVSSVLRLQSNSIGVTPVLKRVSSDVSNPPSDTLLHIMELVVKSNEERGRREMKSLVLRLLRENNKLSVNDGSEDICNENTYNLCRNSLDALLLLFRQAAEPGFTDKSMDSKGPVAKQIALEADNLLWLVEILSDRRAADEFVLMWASQQELSALHSRLPTVSRHLVSCITARLFIGIGRGEILPSKDTRLLLLQTWLQPLIDDYSWLQHGCRSFDQKMVEEGIGRTILTLPLEDQQSILLAWLGSFLKVGDNCPNLHRAFEVWWRRTFIRPYVEQPENQLQLENP
ncbi:BTB/POZ domain-containing protein At3g50780-like [Macadamia integrifolia]|uniref:BTB/POZ domain-containing protein At3g50780-like n=1 Tax=Macadamia integrifolia TaxID=60698 RepID=UPI001C4EC295|nr:BTB/POZ domain-containing protein At3g50780-like [Macadamia integrifolia]